MSSGVTTYTAAQAANILQSRWEHDPLRLFKPAERQAMFLDSAKSEVALLGANRSGKSDALAALVAALARFGNPNPRTCYMDGGRLQIIDRAMSIWVIGLTEKLIKEGVQPKIVTTAYTAAETHQAFIPPSEIDSWNINDQTWRLKNGSLVGFKSADAGRDVFQSAARDLVAFDEICEWDVYKEATFRVPGGGRRLMIRLAATLLPPLGMAGGVSWYFPQKIKPWWNAGNRENTPNGANTHKFLDIFTMGLRHNPHIHPDEILRLEEIFPDASDPERRIRLDGELIGTIGGTPAYTGFNRLVNYDHNVRPENRDMRYPLCLCVDFNVSPCVWVVGQRIDDCWYFFDEIKMDVANVPDMTEMFRRRYPTHNAPLYIYGDQTGKNRSAQTSKSNYFVIQEGLRGYPAPIEMKLPVKNPPVVDRLNAVNRKFCDHNGKVGIVIGPACEETLMDCEEVQRDPKGGIKKTHDPESPYWQRTHGMDCVGYAVDYEDPVPLFTQYGKSFRHMPMPGYNNHARGRGSMGKPPASYDVDGRLRFQGGRIMPPKRYS